MLLVYYPFWTISKQSRRTHFGEISPALPISWFPSKTTHKFQSSQSDPLWPFATTKPKRSPHQSGGYTCWISLLLLLFFLLVGTGDKALKKSSTCIFFCGKSMWYLWCCPVVYGFPNHLSLNQCCFCIERNCHANNKSCFMKWHKELLSPKLAFLFKRRLASRAQPKII